MLREFFVALKIKITLFFEFDPFFDNEIMTVFISYLIQLLVISFCLFVNSLSCNVCDQQHCVRSPYICFPNFVFNFIPSIMTEYLNNFAQVYATSNSLFGTFVWKIFTNKIFVRLSTTYQNRCRRRLFLSAVVSASCYYCVIF